jgi:hypothetical protein
MQHAQYDVELELLENQALPQDHAPTSLLRILGANRMLLHRFGS